MLVSQLPTEKKQIYETLMLRITSGSFEMNSSIPRRYTCDGMNLSPSLHVEGIPFGTRSLAIIAEDSDAPIRSWVHWLKWDIPVRNDISEDFSGGIDGLNDFGKTEYCGPCPPRGIHRYTFRVYALDGRLGLKSGSDRSTLEKAMRGHVIAKGELMGLYGRTFEQIDPNDYL